jgi:ubiquinone/menaquinone biosynthesis C-methylase UbiE
VIDLLQLPKDAVVADVGSGTGYFAVRFARKVKHVWASDIEESMTEYIQKRAEQEGLENLTAVTAATDNPNLPLPVDIVFICNTYHHIEKRREYFRKLYSSLTSGARVVIVDFKMGDLPVGPPERHRISPVKVVTEMQDAGYTVTGSDQELLPYQYVLQFRLDPPDARVTAAP